MGRRVRGDVCGRDQCCRDRHNSPLRRAVPTLPPARRRAAADMAPPRPRHHQPFCHRRLSTAPHLRHLRIVIAPDHCCSPTRRRRAPQLAVLLRHASVLCPIAALFPTAIIQPTTAHYPTAAPPHRVYLCKDKECCEQGRRVCAAKVQATHFLATYLLVDLWRKLQH